MSPLQRLAAEAALRKMADQGHFSICTIDKIREASGLGRGSGEAYSTLSLLHCIDYGKMPAELRDALPGLIAAVLMEPALDFSLSPKARELEVVVEGVAPTAKRPLLLRMFR